jgi:hypothetical protein
VATSFDCRRRSAGTRLADAVLEQFRKGAVIAGTSAGASAMSSHMIAFGASGATPKHRMAQIAAGLGVLPGVIIDQHFQQRNRLGRLLSLIAQNPSLLGLGVDEDTAGVVSPDHVMEVIGRGSITVVDGARSETDAWEVKGHRPLMISGVVLHSLPAGYRFDLQRRERVLAPTLHALKGGEAASGRTADCRQSRSRPVAPLAQPRKMHGRYASVARLRLCVRCMLRKRCRAEGRRTGPVRARGTHYTDRPPESRRASVTDTAEPTAKPKRPRSNRADPQGCRHTACDRGPDDTRTDPADPRDPRPARPELLGARAGHPDAGRSGRPGGVPVQPDPGL